MERIWIAAATSPLPTGRPNGAIFRANIATPEKLAAE